MRPSPLAHSVLLCSVITTGCELSTGPARGTYRGVYVSAFEVSAFTPCGGTRAWWLTGNLTDVFGAGDGGPVPPNGVRAFSIRVRGARSRAGRYGHLGSYRYELSVEEVLEARTDTTAACR